jgi:hypothetical protein
MGPLVFNAWRGFATVKSKISPSQPRSSRQTLIRAYEIQQSRAWRALTDSNRATWNAWAADHPLSDWTGGPKRLSGFNWYVGLSVRLLLQGKAVVATAPVAAAPGAVLALVATPGAGQVSLAFTAFGGTATSLEVWIQPAYSPGRIPSFQRARFNSFAPGETTPRVITGLTAGWTTAYCRSVSETDGQCSGWVSVSFTVT